MPAFILYWKKCFIQFSVCNGTKQCIPFKISLLHEERATTFTYLFLITGRICFEGVEVRYANKLTHAFISPQLNNTPSSRVFFVIKTREHLTLTYMRVQVRRKGLDSFDCIYSVLRCLTTSSFGVKRRTWAPFVAVYITTLLWNDTSTESQNS